MAFCSNCGVRLNERAKYCPDCGSSVATLIEVTTKRKQEYLGSIIKCPSCGEELPSLTARCPSCGHEINQARVSSSIRLFADQINQWDIAIVSGPNPPKKGWNSWGTGARVMWVILNIYTLCIPLVFYFTLPLFKYGHTPSLSVSEKNKATFIENYTFPNDRESIIEALLFIKAKTTFLASEPLNDKAAYWYRLWTAKAEQIYQKSEIVLKRDEIVQNVYDDIQKDGKVVKDQVKKKAFLGAAIIITVIMCLTLICIFNPRTA